MDAPRTDGVALWALREFADEVRDKHGGAAYTTGEVNFKVVKPATLSRTCAYADLELLGDRKRHGKPAVAPATVFISHAWANPFADLVDALEATLDIGDYVVRDRRSARVRRRSSPPATAPARSGWIF